MDKLSVAREALEPFAKIGQYMRHTPSVRSVDLFYNAVEGDGLNSRGKARLSVENFHAARKALAALAQPAPDVKPTGPEWEALVKEAAELEAERENEADGHCGPYGNRKAEDCIDDVRAEFEAIGRAYLAALTPAPQPAEFGVQRPKRLKYYPDYIDDPAGLKRFREGVKTHSGHDMADVNYNSLGRLIDTIERLRFERDAAESIAAAIRGGADGL